MPSIRLLSNLETSQSDLHLPGSRDVLMAEVEDDWRLDFMTYILEKRVPEDKVELEKIIKRSANYVVIATELYRRSASNGVLMKSILQSEGLQVLQEIHGGECGNHAASANLVGKPSGRFSTSQLPWLTLKTWFGDAKVANSSPSSSTSRPKL
jgi:hypothetical protein